MKKFFTFLLLLSFIIMASGQQTCNPPTNVTATTYSYDKIRVTWNGPDMGGRSDATPQSSRLVLFDQAKLVNYPGAGFNGTDVSALYADQNIYGNNANYLVNAFVADDFTLSHNSYVSEMQFYAYQTGSGLDSSSIKGVYVSIWDHNPVEGGAPIWGDFTTNRIISSSWSGIFLTTSTDFLNTDRPIMKVVAEIDTSFSAGNYWVTVAFSGNSALTGPWAPPIRDLFLVNTGNALQFVNNAWVPWRDTQTLGQYGMPFLIRGFAQPDSLAGFNIFRDAVQLNTTLIEDFQYFDDDTLLLPNTQYCYSVNAVYLYGCTSTATTPVCAYTAEDPCVIRSLPYLESFDTYGTGTGTFPTCWTRYYSSTTTTYPYITTTYNSAPGSLYMYSSATYYIMAITPEIDASIPVNTLRATFKLRKSSAAYNIIVGVMDTLDIPSSFVPIDTLSPSAITVWEEFSVDFNNYTGPGKHIAFRTSGVALTTIYVDDLEIYSIPTCDRPNNIRMANITSSSADIVWHPMGVGTMWTLEYKLPESSTWTTVQYLTDTVYTIQNLEVYTEYNFDIRVKSICTPGTDESIWRNASLSFTTQCLEITTLPYYESFDDYGTTSYTSYPYCWSRVTNYSSQYPYISSTTPSSPPGSLYFYATTAYYSYAISPRFDPSFDLSLMQINFQAKKTSTTTTYGRFDIGIMTDPTDISTFSVIQSYYGSNFTATGTWYDFEVLFNTYTGNGKYVAIRAPNEGTGYVYIDNVEISLTPTCIAPTGLTVTNTTASTADLTWHPEGTETSWEIEYKLSSDTIWQLLAVSDTNYTLQLLVSGSAYNVRVRAVCGFEYSRWIPVVNFMTACTINQLPYTENFDVYGTGTTIYPLCWARPATNYSNYPYIYATQYFSPPGSLYCYSTTTTECYGSLPPIDPSIAMTSIQVRFKVRLNTASHIVKVGVMTNPLDSSTFSLVQTIVPGVATTWLEYEVPFSSYLDTGRYISFLSSNPGVANNFAIDDLVVEYIPVCPRPSGITAVTIDTTSASLTWTSVGTESGWIVEYMSTFDDDWTVLNTTSPAIVLTNLTANMGYLFKVKSLCGTTDESDFSNLFSFNTGCGKITSIPYRENFDTYGYSGAVYFPTCWIRTSNHASINYPYIFSTNPYSAPASLYFYAGDTIYSYAISPEFEDAIDLSALQVTFCARNTTATNGKLDIGIMTNPTDISTFTVIRSLTAADYAASSTWYLFEVPLSSYTGSGKHLAFRAPPGSASYALVDNITVDYIATCFRPVDVIVTNRTQTEAEVSWTPVSGEMEWNVSYKPTSGGSWIEVNNIYDTTYTIMGLTSNTSYLVRVQAVCSTHDVSEWTYESSFITRCDPVVTLPYVENFDTYGTGTTIFPACWTKNTTYSYYPYVYSSTPFSPPGSLYFYSTSTTYNLAAMPEMDASIPINSLQVSFKLKKTSAAYNIQVGVMTNPEDVSTFQLIQTLSPTATSVWEDFTVYLLPYTGQGKFIAFKSDRMDAAAANYMYIDNVTVNYIPDCIHPVNVNTSALSSNDATISWNADQLESEWEIVYGPRGFNIDTATIHYTSSNPYYISGLTPVTTYDVYVRTLCATGDTSRWSDMLTFTTSCIPISTIPYNEYFDNYGTGSGIFPDCWIANTNSTSLYIHNTQKFSPPGAIYMYNTATTYSVAVTPEFVPDLNLLQVSFKAKMTNLNYKLEFGVMSNPYDTNTFELIQLIEPTTIYWNEYTIPLNSYSGNAKHIAFKTGFGATNYVYLDNVEVNWAPTCSRPVNVYADSITLTSANIYWTPSGDETEWMLIYGPAGFSPSVSGTVINTTSFPVTLTGFTSQTHYDVYVKAVCSSTLQSAWSLVCNFMTSCEEIATFPYRENFDTYGTGTGRYPDCWTKNSDYITTSYPYISTTNYSAPGSLYFYSPAANYTFAILPKIANNVNVDTLLMTFMMRKTSANYKIEVGVMTDPTNPATFTSVAVVTPSAISVWEEAEILFDSYSGTGKYIAFRSDFGVANYMYVDNVLLDYMPTCLRPVNLEVSGITSSSATVTWHERMNATSWDIEYGIMGFAPGTGLTATVTDTSVIITGLTAQTNYDVYVQSDCGNSTSPRSKISFMTGCSAYTTLPIIESFDNYGTTTYTSFPTCWYRGTNYSYDYPYIISTNNSPPGSLYFYSLANGYTYATTNEISSSIPINSLKATFKLRKSSAAYSLQVGVMTDPANYSTFTSLATLSPTASSIWEDFSVSFASYSGTGKYIAFVSASSAINYMYLDDVVIDSNVVCHVPTNVATSFIGINTATITWNPGGSETEWIFEYKESTSSTWTTINCLVTTRVLSTLLPNTTYNVRIKAICSAIDESNYTPVFNFTTLPDAITYTIYASAGDNGTITPPGSVLVAEGTDQMFTIAPNNGYLIDDVLVDDISQGDISTYTFTNVVANHTITASFAAGIEENSLQNSILIFPNPTNNVLNVKLSTSFESVEVTNLLGQVIYSEKVVENDFTINVSSYTSGVYFLRLKGENGTVTKKFIKE